MGNIMNNMCVYYIKYVQVKITGQESFVNEL